MIRIKESDYEWKKWMSWLSGVWKKFPIKNLIPMGQYVKKLQKKFHIIFHTSHSRLYLPSRFNPVSDSVCSFIIKIWKRGSNWSWVWRDSKYAAAWTHYKKIAVVISSWSINVFVRFTLEDDIVRIAIACNIVHAFLAFALCLQAKNACSI